MDRNFSKIESAVEKACNELEYRLYLVEWNSNGVQVYVDKGAQVLASISDCTKVSRRIYFFLMLEGLSDSLSLEVSSPGLERKLKYLWHFQEVINKRVWLSTSIPYYGKNTFVGDLTQVTDNFVFVESKASSWEIPFDSIKDAHLIFEMKKNIEQLRKNRKKN